MVPDKKIPAFPCLPALNKRHGEKLLFIVTMRLRKYNIYKIVKILNGDLQSFMVEAVF